MSLSHLLFNVPGLIDMSAAQLQVGLDYFYSFDEPTGAGTYWDLTKNANELTIANGAPSQAAGRVGNAVSFNSATPDSLVCADNSFTKHDSNSNSITISFWYQSVTSLASTQSVISKRNNTDAIDYSITSDTNHTRLTYNVTVDGSFTNVSSPSVNYASYWQNQWRMVTIQHDTTNKFIRIKIDNDDWTTTTYSGTFNPTSTPSLRIASLTSGTNGPINGRVDSLGKWSRLLSDAEISFLYNAGNGRALYSDPNTYLMDDKNPTEADFYSVTRKLVSTWRGALIRVRRSSDNTQRDIWADANGNLDTASLLAFVGAGDGFITTVYAQHSNRAADAVQNTSGRQPRIVTAGVLLTDPTGKPEPQFDGTDDFLERRDATAFSNTVVQMVAVHRPADAPATSTSHGTVFSYGCTASNTFVNYFARTTSVPGSFTAFSSGTSNRMGSSQNNLWSAGQRLVTAFNSANNTTTYNNTTVTMDLTVGAGTSGNYTPSALAGLNLSANTPKTFIGVTQTSSSGFAVYYKGGISELVVYTSANASNLEAVRQNQMTFYGAS